MKQFEKMGWIRRGFLGLIVCAVMSPIHAMSVRERYLLQHPQATHQDVASPAPAHKVVKHARKHHAVKKQTVVRHKASQHRNKKLVQPVAKHTLVKTSKSRHQRLIVQSKHTKSKLNKQQARDASAALKQRRMKVKPTSIAKHHVRKASAKHVTHHVVKPVPKHHRKHHRVR